MKMYRYSMYLALVLSLFGIISFFPLTGCRFLFEDLYYSESNDSEDGVCTVTGTVTFDDGTPAGGAIVSVYYTQNLETSTDTSGTFSVEVTWPYYKDPPYEGVISAYYSEAEQVSQALTLQKNKTISVDITIPRVGVIESGIAQEGYIQESGETDWYKFSALAGEMVEVTLQQHVSPVDPEVALYQSGSTTALWSESDRDGQDAPTELNSGNLLIEADGDYYVRVKDYGDNDTSAVTPYLLTVSVMNNPDLAEPVNNERDGAIELTSGSPRQGHIATVNDVDWYKIDAYAGQAVRVEASLPQNNELGLKVEIYEQYSTSRFWYDYDSNAETAPLSFDSGQQLISTDGTYYIRVSGYGHSITVPYTLTVSVTNNPDSAEPVNNERDGAIELTSGSSRSGYIATVGDIDWYKIDAYAGQAVRVEASLPQNNELGLKVEIYEQYSTSRFWYDYDSNAETAPISFDSGQQLISTDGTYYIRVLGYGHSMTVPYTLRVTVANNPDSVEPENNERDGAIELTSGSSRSGYIATVGDIDWYKIDAYAGQAVRVEASLPQNNELGLKVEIYEQYSTSRFWYDYDSNAETAPISFDSGQQLISTDGTYYIRVVGYGHTMTVPYTLKVTVN